jgi:hypothetical protein
MKNVENEAESAKFKVKDRRRFSPEGEPLDESPMAAEPGEAGPVCADAEAARADQDASANAEQAEPAFDSSSFAAGQRHTPTASFELLVLSLAMQAELELGTHGKPEEQPPNLDIARHSIDMLGVLQEKTKGNLSFEEKRQLDNAVTMLRFRYVQAVQELNQKAKA